MRNLQKILALVLALIMSFSLVATAGAFSDDGDISDAYKDAVTVLNGLEVFKGYDNGATFQPKGNITRAEVAAIIYRIATGDVKDTQASIYSTYGQFTDVLDGSWYAGYVNYCANAGYIKGRGNKIFDPQATVTGYEALAMILRAVGYDKNGEFTGSNWQIRTASIANERGISKNVTSAMLGQAATREVVAELLFRSIIIPKVNFNANTLSYTEKPLNADGKKDTLGYESLKLEEITGIVTANEYADLEKSITLNDGKTRMRVDGVDGQDYILDYTEENLLDGLDAIGEEHNAYIQNANTTSAKVLVMAKTDNNKTYETLEEVEIDTDSKFREKTGFQRSASATEDFLNFDEVNEWHSDWRIKYVVSSRNSDVEANAADLVKEINIRTGFKLPDYSASNKDYALIPDGNTGKYFVEYTREFRIDASIVGNDRVNIEEIFNIADKLNNGYVRGEVYVGTSSMKDISDEISFKQFVEQYIDNTEAKITDNENGNWLKVIDNDNDGQAEYVLKIVYTMAQVVRAKDGKYGLDTEDVELCNSKKGADDAVNFIDDDDVRSEDTLALDDIVYYAVIDDKAWATKAETAEVKIDTVNRKDLKVTTTDGTEYTQSGVCEEIVSNDYNSGVVNMNGSATYTLYFDRGGYLAAFTDAHGGDYTLIVDGWYNSTKNGIEYSVRAYNDETKRQDVVDVTRGGSLFIDSVVWDNRNVLNNDWGALKWLGGTNGNTALNNDTAPFAVLNGETASATQRVKTTVASLSGDVLQPVDYSTVGDSKIVRMLDVTGNVIPKAAATPATAYWTGNRSDTAYNSNEGAAELRALSSTTYYLVYPSRSAESGFVVERYVGYGNVPSVNAAAIEDVYAVGTRQNRTSTLGANTYFTAEVVVVELNENYRGKQEQVFIYDMPVVSGNVTIEEVGLIREDGSTANLRIDFEKSNIRYYQVAGNAASGWRNWGPGLYYLYTTGTEDLYTVEPMTPADIAANDYVVGWSATSLGTVKNDYISVLAFGDGSRAYGLVEKAAKSDSMIYTLAYNDRGVADLGTYAATEGNIKRYLDESVDESRTEDRDFTNYDHTPFDADGCTQYWNQNRVLVHYDDGDAVYAISFSNKNNGMGNDNGLARQIWKDSQPSWTGSAANVLGYAEYVAGLKAYGTYSHDKSADEIARVVNALNALTNLSSAQQTKRDEILAALSGAVNYNVTINVVDAAGEAVPAAGGILTASANTVSAGSNVDFTLHAVAGYKADSITVNGVAQTVGNFTLTVNENVVVTVVVSEETVAGAIVIGRDPNAEGKPVYAVNADYTAEFKTAKPGDTLYVDPADAAELTGDVDKNADGSYTVRADAQTITLAVKAGWNYTVSQEMWLGTVNGMVAMTVNRYTPAASGAARSRAVGDTVDPSEPKWLPGIVKTVLNGDEVAYEISATDGEYTFVCVKIAGTNSVALKLVGDGDIDKALAAFMTDIDSENAGELLSVKEVEAPQPTELEKAQEAAKQTVGEYKADEIAALTGEEATAAQAAKDAALAAIEAAKTVEEVNKAVADYQAAIDELLDVPAENKLVVEPVIDRTDLLGKIAANIQDGIQVEKQADGTTYKVTGNVFYTSGWTAYSSQAAGQNGYFIALKLTHPDVDSSMILLNRAVAPFEGAANGTSTYLKDDGILVYKIAVKDNKADSFTATVMLDDGTREVSTIDLSGLTLGEDTSELAVQAVDPNGQDAVQWGANVADLQSNVTVDPAENGVIKVHGAAKYFDGTNVSPWATNWGDLKTGYFVALKLNFPGVADNGIDIYYTSDSGTPKPTADRQMSDGDVLLWKIKPSTAMKPINNVKVVAEGKTYTIDISDVTLRGTTMSLSAVTDDSINLLKKKASELQSDIVVSGPVGNRFTVTGTSKYIPNWTDFSGSDNSGNFVALQISWPGVQNDQIDYGWGTANKDADKDGLFVFRLQNGDASGQIMKFKANGITYEVDLSGIARESNPNPTDGLIIHEPRQSETAEGPSTKVSAFNAEPVTVDGYTVSGGKLAYQNKTDNKHGYYVALYITKGETKLDSRIWYRVPGTSAAIVSEGVSGHEGIFLLPVKVGKDMFNGNKTYTSLEVATVAAGARTDTPDWTNSITVDLSGLTDLGVVPTAESYPENEDFTLGGLTAPGSTFQTITSVSGPDENNVITVEGSLNWINPNDAYGEDENSGYYGIIRFKVDPAVKSVFTLHKIHETEGTPDGSAESGWKSVTVADGFLDLMTHVASRDSEKPENSVLYVDGVRYEVNWNVKLSAQPMPTSLD